MEKNLSKRESNKALKKEAFLSAAEELFIQKGFENTSIDEVAKKASLTKRTLYQYFVNKEDLFYAVALKGVKQLLSAYEDAMGSGATTLEKIRLGNKAYLKFYEDNIGMFRLINYTPANRQNSELSPNFEEITVMDGVRMKYFMDFMIEGKKDGSVNPGLDMKKAIFFAFYSAFSLLYTVSSTGVLWEALDLDAHEFLEFSFDMFSNALK